MELGRHLVHELGLADSVDTLGRWLAHEIADAMSEATSAKTAAERARLRSKAVELITMLWAHRERLSNRAYPLAPLRELLGVISLFTLDDSRAWWGYRREDATEAQLFRAFSLLMPCLLLLHAARTDRLPGQGDAEYEHLTEDERAILDDVSAWFRLRNPPPKQTDRTGVTFVSSDESEDSAEGEKSGSYAQDEEIESVIRARAVEAATALEEALSAVRKRLDSYASGEEAGEGANATDPE